jgi:hypothetical protein
LKAFTVASGTVPGAVTFLHPHRATGNNYLASVPIIVHLQDGTTAINQGSIALKLNGQAITPTKTYTAPKTVLTYDPPGNLPAGTNTLEISFTAGAQTYNATNTFVVQNPFIIPPSLLAPAGFADTAKPGFLARTVQQTAGRDNNTIAGEVHLAGFFGYTNIADNPPAPASGFYEITGALNLYNDGTGAWTGDVKVPGVDLPADAGGNTDNFTQEILTVVQFPEAGWYQFQVNSDDGFRITIGHPAEVWTTPIVLSEFSGGRGAGGGIGDGTTGPAFYIQQAGLYPVRLMWYEGGGGASCEWSFRKVDANTGALALGPILMNDPNNNAALKCYQWTLPLTTVPAYVKSVLPAREGRGNYGGVDSAVHAVISDGWASIPASSVKLSVNGTDVTASTQVTKAGGETVVHYKPATPWVLDSVNAVALTFGDRTVNWSFQASNIRWRHLPAGAPTPQPVYVIEAEDFNYNSGQTKAEASVMPYTGGAYAGLNGIVNTDYTRGNDENNGITYRPDQSFTTPMSWTGTGETDRGFVELKTNFRLGWIGGGQWYNYTRTIPAGNYNVWAALSHGDAESTATRIGGKLYTVDNATQPDTAQVKTQLGVFHSASTGGWGNNYLVPLRDSATTNEILSIPLTGTVTLRFEPTNGDIDYFLMTPATEARPQITGAVIQPNGDVVITWTGGGKPQIAQSLSGTIQWTDVDATSPLTWTPPPGTQQVYLRIKR